MLKEIVVSGFCLALLLGCDSSSKSEVEKVTAGASSGQGGQQTTTALYLPGGVGIDFGRAPVSDKVKEDKISKIRIVRYEFSESSKEIDASIASIVEAEGYARKVNPPGADELSVTYHKQGARPVLSRYVVRVQEGFDKKTVLTLSWRF